MPEAADLNIQDILSKSVSPATVDDLRKQGLKNVLVLNKENVKNLIAQAVEAAIERRSRSQVAEAVRGEAEKGRAEIETMIREQEKALANQALLVADRTRMERELAEMRDGLEARRREIESERQRLADASKAELDSLLAVARDGAGRLPELQARLRTLEEEHRRVAADAQASARDAARDIESLRERLDQAEKARDAAAGELRALRERTDTLQGVEAERRADLEAQLARAREGAGNAQASAREARNLLERLERAGKERDEARAEAVTFQERVAALQAAEAERLGHAESSRAVLEDQLARAREEAGRLEEERRRLAEAPRGVDPADMERLLERFKAGIALELTQTLGSPSARPSEDLKRLSASVISSHVDRAFEESMQSNLDTVRPQSRRSMDPGRLSRIRERLNDSKTRTPEPKED